MDRDQDSRLVRSPLTVRSGVPYSAYRGQHQRHFLRGIIVGTLNSLLQEQTSQSSDSQPVNFIPIVVESDPQQVSSTSKTSGMVERAQRMFSFLRRVSQVDHSHHHVPSALMQVHQNASQNQNLATLQPQEAQMIAPEPVEEEAAVLQIDIDDDADEDIDEHWD